MRTRDGRVSMKGRMAGENLGRSTMTKADIVEKVYQKIGFSKKEASELVELVFTSLKDVLTKGDKVKISGFGNFVVREKNERVGRNPQTGEQIKISARRVLTFRPSQVLKAMLNGEDLTGITDDDE
jgi:integration host factor subunit alpha